MGSERSESTGNPVCDENHRQGSSFFIAITGFLKPSDCPRPRLAFPSPRRRILRHHADQRVRQIAFSQIGAFLRRKRKLGSLYRVLDLRHARHAHNRRGHAPHQPAQRDLRHRNAALFRQLRLSASCCAVFVVFEPCLAVLSQTLRGFAGMRSASPAAEAGERWWAAKRAAARRRG